MGRATIIVHKSGDKRGTDGEAASVTTRKHSTPASTQYVLREDLP